MSKQKLLFIDDDVRIIMDNISTSSMVGIWKHELNPQPILIDIDILASAPVNPNGIDDCIDYDPICHWLTNQFPLLPHTELLEVRILEIFDYVFSLDKRIKSISISIFKTKAFSNVQRIGISKSMSIETFKKMKVDNPIHWHEINSMIA